jgi:hypothetical protein
MGSLEEDLGAAPSGISPSTSVHHRSSPPRGIVNQLDAKVSSNLQVVVDDDALVMVARGGPRRQPIPQIMKALGSDRASCSVVPRFPLAIAAMTILWICSARSNQSPHGCPPYDAGTRWSDRRRNQPDGTRMGCLLPSGQLIRASSIRWTTTSASVWRCSSARKRVAKAEIGGAIRSSTSSGSGVSIGWNREVAHGNAESSAMKDLGMPGAGESHARFDERGLETGHGLGQRACRLMPRHARPSATAPALDSTAKTAGAKAP